MNNSLAEAIAQAIRVVDGTHTMGAGELAEHIADLFEPVGWRFIYGKSDVFGARGVDYSDKDKPDSPNPTEIVWAIKR